MFDDTAARFHRFSKGSIPCFTEYCHSVDKATGRSPLSDLYIRGMANEPHNPHINWSENALASNCDGLSLLCAMIYLVSIGNQAAIGEFKILAGRNDGKINWIAPQGLKNVSPIDCLAIASIKSPDALVKLLSLYKENSIDLSNRTIPFGDYHGKSLFSMILQGFIHHVSTLPVKDQLAFFTAFSQYQTADAMATLTDNQIEELFTRTNQIVRYLKSQSSIDEQVKNEFLIAYRFIANYHMGRKQLQFHEQIQAIQTTVAECIDALRQPQVKVEHQSVPTHASAPPPYNPAAQPPGFPMMSSQPIPIPGAKPMEDADALMTRLSYTPHASSFPASSTYGSSAGVSPPHNPRYQDPPPHYQKSYH